MCTQDIANISQLKCLLFPQVNLPGGGYQVVGSEIVIGGQQVVVIEPSAASHLT